MLTISIISIVWQQPLNIVPAMLTTLSESVASNASALKEGTASEMRTALATATLTKMLLTVAIQNCGISNDLQDDNEGDGNGDRYDNYDNQVGIAAVGHDVNVVFYGFDYHNDVLDDDNGTIPDSQALVNIFKFADVPDLFSQRKRTFLF